MVMSIITITIIVERTQTENGQIRNARHCVENARVISSINDNQTNEYTAQESHSSGPSL